MGFFNFKKKKKDDKGGSSAGPNIGQMMSGMDTSKMSVMQKMAFKFFQKLPKSKQEDVIRKAMNPQNIQKEKGKILKQLNEMVASGQVSKQEAENIKSQLGLR